MIGVLGFDFRRGLRIFLFTTASRTALRPIKPPIQWVPGAVSLGVKRRGREADHSPPSSAEVKNAWSLPPLPQYAFMAWCLVKHRDNFTFTFYLYEYVSKLITYASSHKCWSPHHSMFLWKVKDEVVSVLLSWAPRLEGVLGEWRCSFAHSWPRP
jgi:hypothetical protein